MYSGVLLQVSEDPHICVLGVLQQVSDYPWQHIVTNKVIIHDFGDICIIVYSQKHITNVHIKGL